MPTVFASRVEVVKKRTSERPDERIRGYLHYLIFIQMLKMQTVIDVLRITHAATPVSALDVFIKSSEAKP